MEITDKRLLERMQTSNKRIDINSICKDIPDTAHKAETVEIDHEPICLLKRSKYRKKNPQNKTINPVAPLNSENSGDED